MSRLAQARGSPLFDEPIVVGKPNLGDRRRLHRLLDQAMDRRRLTNDGPLVQAFEERVRKHTRTDYCIAVANATLGLEIAARAVGMRGQVLGPSFTFIASAHALAWIGLRPEFCDVRREDHTIDVSDAASRSVKMGRLGGILGVHLWGNPCDVQALEALAQRRKVPLVLDAAHAFAVERKGVPVGGAGDAEVFSFHATKFLNALEGGAITTNDPAVAKQARLMRNFGISGYDQVDGLGTNAKMNEFSAAVGLVNLEALPRLLETNRRNFEAYWKELRGIQGLRVLTPATGIRPNLQYVVIEVDHPTVSRDALKDVLWANNVQARRYYMPGCHQSEPYRRRRRLLPVTEWLADHVLALPTGTAVRPPQIRRICSLIRGALES